VLFGKDPATSKCEVLNDLDGELINFWRVVKHRPAEFAERVNWLLASRELFNRWKLLQGEGNEVDRAVRFYAVIRLAYGAKRTQCAWGMRRVKKPAIWWLTLRAEFRPIYKRLRGAWIENLPWEKCIETYDGPRTFFYVDPPYHCNGAKSYRHFLGEDDHRRLASVLCQAKGKWLLSYNDDRFIRRLYEHRRGIKIERVRVRYGLQGGLWKQARELLIRNY
jgi:DNA adenine methylase